MITFVIAGLAVLGCVAVVLALVDRMLESTWRAIAASRRDAWQQRHPRH